MLRFCLLLLLVLLDDVGYGASSTFGGPINTPTLERLAKNGLKYTNFHTTALCSPTRAALITGRNHHSVHTGVIMEGATGYPVGWAHAMNAPFQWAKQVASLYGGTANGLVISWPAKIKNVSQIRTQWHHVSIQADLEVPQKGADGMIITQSGLFGGWALYLDKGKPAFDYNTVNKFHYTISSPQVLEPGKHTLVFEFKYDGGGLGKGATGTLSADGKQIAEGRIEHSVPVRYSLDEGLDVGEDTGTPVNLNYDVPFKFTGKIYKVTVDLKPQDKTSADASKAAQVVDAIHKSLQD